MAKNDSRPIDNTRLYLGLHAGFAKAFEILTDKTLSKKQDGKYPVDGEKIYYTIQRYTTKPLRRRQTRSPPKIHRYPILIRRRRNPRLCTIKRPYNRRRLQPPKRYCLFQYAKGNHKSHPRTGPVLHPFPRRRPPPLPPTRRPDRCPQSGYQNSTVIKTGGLKMADQIMAENKPHKPGLLRRILWWLWVILLTALLVLGFVFAAPWKVITLIAIFLAAATILPRIYRKWFWLGCRNCGFSDYRLDFPAR